MSLVLRYKLLKRILNAKIYFHAKERLRLKGSKPKEFYIKNCTFKTLKKGKRLSIIFSG